VVLTLIKQLVVQGKRARVHRLGRPQLAAAGPRLWTVVTEGDGPDLVAMFDDAGEPRVRHAEDGVRRESPGILAGEVANIREGYRA
jgi:hypothetical protein